MNKTFEKVKTFTKDFFHFCCLGSATAPYGFSHVYSRAATTQVNLIEPYFDDVMNPMCENYDDVEMLVAFFISVCAWFSFVLVPKILIYFDLLLTRFGVEMQSQPKGENNKKDWKLEQTIQHVYFVSFYISMVFDNSLKIWQMLKEVFINLTRWNKL